MSLAGGGLSCVFHVVPFNVVFVITSHQEDRDGQLLEVLFVVL